MCDCQRQLAGVKSLLFPCGTWGQSSGFRLIGMCLSVLSYIIGPLPLNKWFSCESRPLSGKGHWMTPLSQESHIYIMIHNGSKTVLWRSSEIISGLWVTTTILKGHSTRKAEDPCPSRTVGIHNLAVPLHLLMCSRQKFWTSQPELHLRRKAG